VEGAVGRKTNVTLYSTFKPLCKGADQILISQNTWFLMFPQINSAFSIVLTHIQGFHEIKNLLSLRQWQTKLKLFYYQFHIIFDLFTCHPIELRILSHSTSSGAKFALFHCSQNLPLFLPVMKHS